MNKDDLILVSVDDFFDRIERTYIAVRSMGRGSLGVAGLDTGEMSKMATGR